jgi:oxalate decarboxylase/phosphoglucose isomerase-like protein (cupin superfamily)
MNVATIPPGAVAAAHIHVDFELMLYILAGRVRHYYGPQLDQVLDNEAGDFLYIEPGVPHEVHNLSSRDDVVAVVARSDADEWQNIVSYEVAGRRTPSPLEEATPASSPSRGERGTEGSTNDLAGGALSDVGLVETARDS